MQTSAEDDEQTGSNLLHLLTEVRSDELAVDHYVCLDCMELVEKSAKTAGTLHSCPAIHLWAGSAGTSADPARLENPRH